MTRIRHEHHPGETLEQLQSFGDRLAHWVATHPIPVLAVAGAILLAAAGWGGWQAWSASRVDAASAELAKVRTGFVAAMGGQPGDVDVPEPANPETARTVRTDYLQRFLDLARSQSGTTSGALAALEASELYEALGTPDKALEILQEAAPKLPAANPTLGILQTRIGAALEADGSFEAAAQAYESAAAVAGYPLHLEALGAAARTWAEAGKREQALAAYQRLRTESPEYRLAPWVDARLKELEAGNAR